MYKLRDRRLTPPKGFVWIDPITTQMVEARNYANWRTLAIERRVANRNPLPSEEEMEDQLCQRYDQKTREALCMQVDGDPTVPTYGVGGTLKSMLACFGIHACWSCVDMAKKMDEWGPDGCEEHFEEIKNSMVARAEQGNWSKYLPFKEVGAELCIRRAIAKVRERG